MANTNLFIAVGVAFLLIILIPTVIFPIFYMVFSQYLGCQPVGNANLLFTFNVFNRPQVSAICPPNSQIYEGMLVYTVLLITIIGYILSRVSKYLPLLVIGAFLPSLYFILQKTVNVNLFNYQVIDIISILIMIIGGFLAWNES